jgi:hypothetical protein
MAFCDATECKADHSDNRQQTARGSPMQLSQTTTTHFYITSKEIRLYLHHYITSKQVSHRTALHCTFI